MDTNLEDDLRQSYVSTRAKRACDFCKKKKAKCSGDQPTCRKCRISNHTCVYSPYEKRISILLSRYNEMTETINKLQEEIQRLRDGGKPLGVDGEEVGDEDDEEEVVVEDDDDPVKEKEDEDKKETLRYSLHTATSLKRARKISDASKFKTGSSEIIFKELAGMKRIESNTPQNLKNIDDTFLQNRISQDYNATKKVSILRSKERCDLKVTEYLSELTFDEACQLVEMCHFFLNDIYFPYDVELMKVKLKRIYSLETHFSKFFFQTSTFFRSLVLLTFALGKRYLGETDDIIEYLLYSSLLEVLPTTEIKETDENYLTVATLTMASLYFRAVSRDSDSILYSNLALQLASHIKLHENDENSTLNIFEKEVKARIMWIAYGVNRSLAAKMGDAFLLSYDDIDRSLPTMKSFDETGTFLLKIDGSSELQSEREIKILNSREFILYIELARAAEEIYRVIYSSKPTTELITALQKVIEKLVNWKNASSDCFKLELGPNTSVSRKDKRLICSLHLNYCFCIHLTTIPIVYSLVDRKRESDEFEITGNLSDLLAICINSAQMTVCILISCLNDGILAMFGVMDLDYIYSASLTFFMCGDILNFQFAECGKLLDSCLSIMNQLAQKGNSVAKLKYERLLHLIKRYREHEKQDTAINPEQQQRQQLHEQHQQHIRSTLPSISQQELSVSSVNIQHHSPLIPSQKHDYNTQQSLQQQDLLQRQPQNTQQSRQSHEQQIQQLQQQQEQQENLHSLPMLVDNKNSTSTETNFSDFELHPNYFDSPFNSNIADTFQSLIDRDFNISDTGRPWQRVESYWDDFQRNVFEKN